MCVQCRVIALNAQGLLLEFLISIKNKDAYHATHALSLIMCQTVKIVSLKVIACLSL